MKGRPPAPADDRARDMQARAKAARDEKGLSNVEIAAVLGCAAGTIGRALNESPAKATPTLESIFNYLCAEMPASGRDQVRQLAQQAPESAALLAALFEEVAQVLRNASGIKTGKKRKT